MRDTPPPSPSVVVGIDGSRNALNAALWAVDEAVKRDIPLRLVCAINSHDAGLSPDVAARDLATAEIAVRTALMAVESTDKPVKIEVEILQGKPIDKLLEAGRAAAMICIGAIGFPNGIDHRIGSTAAAIANWAHCPVAIIRSHDRARAASRSVVAEIDRSQDSDSVFERGIDEALLRGAPLVAISVWQSTFTDVHDRNLVAEQNRLIRAELNRRLARTTRDHPELDVRPVAVHGSLLNYLSRHAESTQLVVIGRRRAHDVAEMVGPAGHAALHDTDCSVLVCDPSNSL
jgi:nucleotide-binding universal stress UspA family protein